MLRSFIAVELNDDIRMVVSRLQAQVKDELNRELRKTAPDARLQWVKPASIHLTLKFLGDIREDQVQGIGETLTFAMQRQPAFVLQVRGLGVFPDLRAPRILWIGLEHTPGSPSSSIVGLAKAVDEAMTTIDFLPEAKPFTPHLTLARIKERGREIGRALSNTGMLSKGSPVGTLPVREVSLMKSDLQPSGAVYTRLCDIPLAGSD